MIKRKVAVVIASRANYGRSKSLIQKIKDHKDLKLILVVCGSAILDKFGETSKVIEKDGFKIDYQCNYLLAGSDLRSQATTTGLAIIQLTEIFSSCRPNYVVTVADRYETLATAISASYQNIPLIHLQGGDISGNIDDKVRHAITRLADYHFPASMQSYKNLIKMGESKKTIWMHGCPSMDLINETISFNELIKSSDKLTNLKKDKFFLVLLHPVTDRPNESIKILKNLLEALKEFNNKVVIVSPNVDAGSQKIREIYKKLKSDSENNSIFIENLSPIYFLTLIKNSQACIGNSSSFLREAGLCGVPSLILGNRQNGRELAHNCLVLKNTSKEIIIQKIKLIIKTKKFKPDKRFGDGNAGQKIANTISKLPLEYQNKEKIFFKDI